MKKILVIAIFLSIISLKAQEQNKINLENFENVSVEATELVCKSYQGYDLLFQSLKFTNLTDEEVVFTYNFEVWHQDVCQTCGGDHGPIRTVVLPAYGSVEGTCNAMYDENLMVFDHSLVDSPTAPKAKLTELVINKVQNK